MRVPNPMGCRWCGIEERPHAQQWKPPVGWHKWEQPTQDQIQNPHARPPRSMHRGDRMIREHACITVACDVCNYVYDQDEYTAHFSDLAEARKALTGTGWTITADRKIFCASGDTEHQAALDALMPPEPVMQVPGQLGLDGDTA